MSNTEPVLQTVNVSEARAQLSQLLNQVYRHERRVIVEKSGIPVAAIVSANDLERLRQLDERRRRRIEVLTASWKAFEGEDPDEIEREVARAVVEMRREGRQAPLTTT